MGVQLLGPVQLAGPSGVTTPGPGKERALLCVLALEGGRAVPAHVLVDVLWGSDPPRTATATLRSYVSRLRGAVTASGAGLHVEGGPNGYALDGPPGSVDVEVARTLLSDAAESLRRGDPVTAVRLARKGLSLWRGVPLAELNGEHWVVPYRTMLEELELSLQEVRIEAALANGADVELLPELDALVRAHPLRERLAGQRMVALYRAGRQADALRAYHELRFSLTDQLGLEPGPDLRNLERAVLVHDPALHGQREAPRPLGGTGHVPPTPVIRYTSDGGVHIAYRVDGDGPVDLLVLAGGLIPVDSLGDEPRLADALRRLGRSCRVIHFDRRGLGMSDPVHPDAPPTLEQWMSDSLSVLDAARSTSAAVLAWADGALLGTLLAASHPERVSSLALVNGFARFTEDPEQPWAIPRSVALGHVDETIAVDATPGEFDVLSLIAPSVADEASFRGWWDRAGHRAASPATARSLREVVVDADVRDVLPAVSVPTLVLHRTANRATPVEHGRLLAERIPKSRLVELPGADDLWWVGDVAPLLEEVERLVIGEPLPVEVDRVLVTVLFTDIVSSTERATAAGDRAWASLLARHDATVRSNLVRFGGREVKTTGDGFLATFDGPARAVRAAAAIQDEVADLGIEVRAGLHTGEVEVRDGDIHGIAVHIAARVAARAAAGEILVSRTVVDLVTGAGLRFEHRGLHKLKGLEDEWTLYALHR